MSHPKRVVVSNRTPPGYGKRQADAQRGRGQRMGLPRVEEKAQTGDDLRHWKRYRWEPARMDGWQWLKIVASVVVIVLFCLVAVTPFVSELVGSYWPGRFSR